MKRRQGPVGHWPVQKECARASVHVEEGWLAHLNMGTVRYRSAVTPDTT